MTPNVENLKKLRDIITQVPPENFGMATFFGPDPEGELDPVDVTEPIAEIIKHHCGSVGCMVGWGAIDLDLNPARLEFHQFTNNVLGVETFSDLWEALFGADWGSTDDDGIPIIPPAHQKHDALSRLAYVIKQLEDDPDWVETEHCELWLTSSNISKTILTG